MPCHGLLVRVEFCRVNVTIAHGKRTSNGLLGVGRRDLEGAEANHRHRVAVAKRECEPLRRPATPVDEEGDAASGCHSERPVAHIASLCVTVNEKSL